MKLQDWFSSLTYLEKSAASAVIDDFIFVKVFLYILALPRQSGSHAEYYRYSNDFIQELAMSMKTNTSCNIKPDILTELEAKDEKAFDIFDRICRDVYTCILASNHKNTYDNDSIIIDAKKFECHGNTYLIDNLIKLSGNKMFSYHYTPLEIQGFRENKEQLVPLVNWITEDMFPIPAYLLLISQIEISIWEAYHTYCTCPGSNTRNESALITSITSQKGKEKIEKGKKAKQRMEESLFCHIVGRNDVFEDMEDLSISKSVCSKLSAWSYLLTILVEIEELNQLFPSLSVADQEMLYQRLNVKSGSAAVQQLVVFSLQNASKVDVTEWFQHSSEYLGYLKSFHCDSAINYEYRYSHVTHADPVLVPPIDDVVIDSLRDEKVAAILQRRREQLQDLHTANNGTLRHIKKLDTSKEGADKHEQKALPVSADTVASSTVDTKDVSTSRDDHSLDEWDWAEQNEEIAKPTRPYDDSQCAVETTTQEHVTSDNTREMKIKKQAKAANKNEASAKAKVAVNPPASGTKAETKAQKKRDSQTNSTEAKAQKVAQANSTMQTKTKDKEGKDDLFPVLPAPKSATHAKPSGSSDNATSDPIDATPAIVSCNTMPARVDNRSWTEVLTGKTSSISPATETTPAASLSDQKTNVKDGSTTKSKRTKNSPKNVDIESTSSKKTGAGGGAATESVPLMLQKRLTKSIRSFNNKFCGGIKMEGHKLAFTGLYLQISAMVHSLWPHATVRQYGSCVTGLALPTSDVDLVIVFDGYPVVDIAPIAMPVHVPMMMPLPVVMPPMAPYGFVQPFMPVSYIHQPQVAYDVTQAARYNHNHSPPVDGQYHIPTQMGPRTEVDNQNQNYENIKDSPSAPSSDTVKDTSVPMPMVPSLSSVPYYYSAPQINPNSFTCLPQPVYGRSLRCPPSHQEIKNGLCALTGLLYDQPWNKRLQHISTAQIPVIKMLVAADILLSSPSLQQDIAKYYYNDLRQVTHGQEEAANIGSIALPVLPFHTVSKAAISLDITIESGEHRGLLTCEYIQQALKSRSNVVPSVIKVMKEILRQAGLNKPFNGGLSSFPLYIMVIAAYDELCSLEQVTNAGKEITEGSLLIHFLKLYGSNFDHSQFGIEVVTSRAASADGTPPPSSIFTLSSEQKVTLGTSLWVSDPLEPTKNCARSTFAYVSIKQYLATVLNEWETVSRSRSIQYMSKKAGNNTTNLDNDQDDLLSLFMKY